MLPAGSQPIHTLINFLLRLSETCLVYFYFLLIPFRETNSRFNCL